MSRTLFGMTIALPSGMLTQLRNTCSVLTGLWMVVAIGFGCADTDLGISQASGQSSLGELIEIPTGSSSAVVLDDTRAFHILDMHWPVEADHILYDPDAFAALDVALHWHSDTDEPIDAFFNPESSNITRLADCTPLQSPPTPGLQVCVFNAESKRRLSEELRDASQPERVQLVIGFVRDNIPNAQPTVLEDIQLVFELPDSEEEQDDDEGGDEGEEDQDPNGDADPEEDPNDDGSSENPSDPLRLEDGVYIAVSTHCVVTLHQAQNWTLWIGEGNNPKRVRDEAYTILAEDSGDVVLEFRATDVNQWWDHAELGPTGNMEVWTTVSGVSSWDVDATSCFGL